MDDTELEKVSVGLERFLQERIFGDLEKGRSTDKEHTVLVVEKLKEIVRNSPNFEVDLDVLLIAAYAHDWGYADLFENKLPLNLAEIGKNKDTHMLIGAKKLTELLRDPFFDFLTDMQKERAVHLVGAHDKLADLKDVDELILMEADTLGGLEPDVMGVFEYEESEVRFMQKNRDKRFVIFITDYGKREYERLFQKRQEFFMEHKNRVKK